MKIKNLDATPIRVPLREPFKLSSFTVYFMHYVVIKVETDDGIVGFGEAAPSWDVNGETMESVVGFIRLLKSPDILGYSMIGEQLDAVEDVERLMTTVIDPQDRFALIAGNSSAKAGLEQALFHVVTQKTGSPLYELLKGENRPVPFSTTISILPVRETVERVKRAVRGGSPVIRLKIGQRGAGELPDYERDILVIRQAKQIIEEEGGEAKLVADANQGLVDQETTLRFCKEVEGCLDWLEQPVLSNDIDGFAAVKNGTGIPLMADESLSSPKDAARFFENGGADYFNIKLMKTGGIYGALNLIRRAEAHGVQCYIGSMIESALGIIPGLVVAMLRPRILGSDLNVFEELAGQYALKPKISENTILLDRNHFQSNINDTALTSYFKASS